MSPLAVAAVVGFVVLVGLLTTCGLCIGSTIGKQAADIRRRLLVISPYLGVTGLFFLMRRLTNDMTVALSEDIGFRITDWIYSVEGLFVARLQAATPDPLIPVFSGFYMFGFAYLLVTPIVLYLLAPDLRKLKELLVAYVLNYLSGTLFYTLFIAYGPRIRVSGHVDGLLYDLFPESQELTAAMSSKTDVFPSLHTSLAIIVLLFAYQTRHTMPRWFSISAVVSAGVVLSTMILGIHWFIDVLAGVLLAVGCVVASQSLVTFVEGQRQSPTDESPTETV